MRLSPPVELESSWQAATKKENTRANRVLYIFTPNYGNTGSIDVLFSEYKQCRIALVIPFRSRFSILILANHNGLNIHKFMQAELTQFTAIS